MRIGPLLLPSDPWPDTVAQVQHLEAAGFDTIWTYDHMTWRRYREKPWLSTMAWLSGVAASTTSVRLGTLVANPNIRHPLNMAKDIVSVDAISDGRLTLGIGTGGLGYDATVYGEDELTPGQRIDRLAEHLDLLDRLMTGEAVSHSGAFYELHEALVLPRPVQQPRIPLIVAAGQARGLDLAAREGDGWITWGDTTLGDLSAAGTDVIVADQMGRYREACERYGRRWHELRRVFLIGNTEARPLTSVEAFVDFTGRYGEMGFTDLAFHHPRDDDPVWNDDPSVVEGIAARLDELAEL